MEKSSLNIKSFRNLLSNQNKNYKISPKSNHYHPTEVKLNGLNGSIDDSTGSCNIEELYSIKRAKSEDSECSKRNSADVICGNWVKFFSNYNSSFCLTVLTPVACRQSSLSVSIFPFKFTTCDVLCDIFLKSDNRKERNEKNKRQSKFCRYLSRTEILQTFLPTVDSQSHNLTRKSLE
ncbi:CLUMA_CG017331, isoform A [Clunio marinus]|uniref:CLUMA_CG017331, isoform A n=1 Tax=Clunio marinus TaxID=568069 RepID=A0A1J1IWZ7_9DIPT|nr:CLUMA_CG017331, isoform A [Clunio marinus]